jgi:hypothetical protein
MLNFKILIYVNILIFSYSISIFAKDKILTIDFK